jgi:GT2 family glycosyltransferase
MPSLSSDTPLSTTIIIPQFNHPELTLHAIRSLRRFDSHRWPILIVDNGSSAESLRQMHELDDPDTEILALPRQGLTAAWNIAARQCRTATLVFLNNDTLSSGPWVGELLSPLERHATRISGVELRRETHLHPAIELLSGWCFAFGRDTFQAVEGFDESLALYFSDTDFQLRVRSHFADSAIPAWTALAGLPLSHLSHGTAHQLSNQRPLWRADRDRFQARWNRSH